MKTSKLCISTVKITFPLLLFFVQITYSQEVRFNITNSKPAPPNYQSPPEVKSVSATILNDVPCYLWSYGCTNTSAAMLAGYYDRNGYYCIYNGTINGGVAPLKYNAWKVNNLPGPSPNSYYPNYNNSLSASIKGYDGRTINGNIDDFWLSYKPGAGTVQADPHPYVNGQSPHDLTISPCLADYLGTSQAYFNMDDANTRVTTWKGTNIQIIDYQGGETLDNAHRARDITHGLKLFFEEGCGYTVSNVYSQPIFGFDGIQDGFTFENFISQISSKRPVLIHFEGHSAIGIGYDTDGNIYVYDTWNTSKTKLKWGDQITDPNGNKLSMESVTVIELYGDMQLKSASLRSGCAGPPVGEFDYVTIGNPPSGSGLPSNTLTLSPGSNTSFYAQFTSYNNNTWVTSWDWKIELYHNNGTYVYATQNIQSAPNAMRWVYATSNSLPNYDWIYENGNISGKVIATVHINDGDTKSDEVRIGIIPPPCVPSISNTIYSSTDTTILIRGCDGITFQNVNVQNNCNVIIDSPGSVNINAPFEVGAGSSLETIKN